MTPSAFELIGAFLSALPDEDGGYVAKKSEARDLLAGRTPSRRWRRVPGVPKRTRLSVSEQWTPEFTGTAANVLRRFSQTFAGLLRLDVSSIEPLVKQLAPYWDDYVANLPPSGDEQLTKSWVWSKRQKRLVRQQDLVTIEADQLAVAQDHWLQGFALDLAIRAGAYAAMTRSAVTAHWATRAGTRLCLDEVAPGFRRSRAYREHPQPTSVKAWARGAVPSRGKIGEFLSVLEGIGPVGRNEQRRRLLLQYGLTSMALTLARGLGEARYESLVSDWKTAAATSAKHLLEHVDVAKRMFGAPGRVWEQRDDVVLGMLLGIWIQGGTLSPSAAAAALNQLHQLNRPTA